MDGADAVATRFVLIEPSHPGNVGAVARAMKVMGFDDLVLVRPRWPDVLMRPETIDRSSGADDILARARVEATLDAALNGMTHVCATVMTPRDFGPPTETPRAHFARLLGDPHSDAAQPLPRGVAFLFGCERYGMRNDDVYHCAAALSIPSNPHYGSLNLAAALQLIAYDWRMALAARFGGWKTLHPGSAAVDPDADVAGVDALLDHWEQALVAVGFLDPALPMKLMPRLQQLAYRSHLTQPEVNLLRGVARAMLNTARRAQANNTDPDSQKGALSRPPLQ